MELPIELRNLYRHWDQHLAGSDRTPFEFKDPELGEKIGWFIHERITIWEKKYRGEKPPFTSDLILSEYRFCNMYREFDKQTIFFHTILNPLRDNFPLWLMNMFYCRMVANIDTVQHVGLLSFDSTSRDSFYKRLNESPRPRFGTPYVFPVSTIMRSEHPTRESFIAFYLPQVMEKIAAEIETWDKESVFDGTKKVTALFGFNHNFLWNEVLIDVAYQYPEYVDLFKTFPVGPGSIPTLTRIDKSTKPEDLTVKLGASFFETGITLDGKPIRLSAENWEGVGCEFRKYTNLSAGKGRKRKFKTA